MRGLRSNLTLWLRARGYVSDTDIQQSKSSMMDDDEDSPAQLSYSRSNPSLSSNLGSMSDTPLSSSTNATDQLSTGNDLQEPTRAGLTAPKKNARNTAPAVDRDPNAPNPDDVVHRTAPYNLLAMRDLYTQIPTQTSFGSGHFGSDVFSYMQHGYQERLVV